MSSFFVKKVYFESRKLAVEIVEFAENIF